MPTSLHINDILSKVKKMDKEERINLLQQLVLLLKKSKVTKNAAVRLTSLSGLHSEVWKDTDIDKYIDEERQW